MLIANCKVPRIEPSWMPFQNKEEIEVGLLPDTLAVNDIPAHGVGCYQAFPHIDDTFPDVYFVILVAQSYHHVLSDASVYPRQYILKKGDLVIIDPMELHWLYQTPQSSSRFRRRGYWLGIEWEVPKENNDDKLKHFVSAVVARFHGKWKSRYDAGSYANLLPT